MRKYIIERELPGVGDRPTDAFCADAQRSKDVLDVMGTRIQWLESFVARDKLFCVYLANGVEDIREHAERSGFPAHAVHEIVTIIDPTTAAA